MTNIHQLLESRRLARLDKNYEEADRLRLLLAEQGVEVIDTPYGQKTNREHNPDIASLYSKIDKLEFENKVLREREAQQNKRIAELVKENTNLKYEKLG